MIYWIYNSIQTDYAAKTKSPVFIIIFSILIWQSTCTNKNFVLFKIFTTILPITGY